MKVERRKAVSLDDCANYLDQPVQYGVGCGSQFSILAVLDHSAKEAPPGMVRQRRVYRANHHAQSRR